MNFNRDAETNSVSLRLRKPYTTADLTSHTVLTDDVFSYVDFYFKTHKRIIKNSLGKTVEQNYLFYWEQAKNFYKAAKVLPIESAPLPMYYCMLNAMKAYLIYNTKSFDTLARDLGRHGLGEGKSDEEDNHASLSDIFIRRDSKGVFSAFGKSLNNAFENVWKSGKTNKISIKELMAHLPFIHSAYISTYKLPKKDERFIPLVAGKSPVYKYPEKGNIRLVAEIDKAYFRQDAVSVPEDVKKSLPDTLEANPDNGFEVVSKEPINKKDIKNQYLKYRKAFSYISGEKRIWYLNRFEDENSIGNLNSMILEVAITHRFSEIVRYKPEQMIKLLHSKENWLIHEFLSLVLDQFMDEIACEITKQEIMPTRVKS